MSHFSSSAKQYSAANVLVGFGSISVNVTTAGTTLEQTAPPFLLGPDNQQLGFLFWDTGRRVTNKRTVRWTFNHPENWTDWNAIAWYGEVGPDFYEPHADRWSGQYFHQWTGGGQRRVAMAGG
jgi:hypothetical protein